MRRIFLAAIISTAMGSRAGVYRHDVDPQKYKELAAQKQFECAGQVIGENLGIAGSCVLVGDRFVLCAAHVFVTSDPAKPDTVYENGNMVILNRSTNPHITDVSKFSFRFKREIRYGKGITVYPVYKNDIQGGNCDIVLIELNEPITDITPASLNADFNEVHNVATGIGWGASGKANEPENVGIWFEEIAGQNMIDTAWGYVLNGKPVSLVADFDHPTNFKDCNKTGSPKPLPLEYMTSGGDSGGGLFKQDKNGNWKLIGICTGGGVNFQQLMKTGYYGQMGEWTRVSVFKDWIDTTIADIQKTVAK